jgi:hypothetical protein
VTLIVPLRHAGPQLDEVLDVMIEIPFAWLDLDHEHPLVGSVLELACPPLLDISRISCPGVVPHRQIQQSSDSLAQDANHLSP